MLFEVTSGKHCHNVYLQRPTLFLTRPYLRLPRTKRFWVVCALPIDVQLYSNVVYVVPTGVNQNNTGSSAQSTVSYRSLSLTPKRGHGAIIWPVCVECGQAELNPHLQEIHLVTTR